MTTLENRIEEFKTVCKAFNLRREYGENYSGDEKWAIITALSDEELQAQFGDVVNVCYSPYLLLTPEQGAAIIEQKNNDAKYERRQQRHGHIFDITDGEFEEHHPEVVDETDLIEEIMLQDNIKKLREALFNLNDKQKCRVIKYFFYNKTFKQIAEEEGVSAQSVQESVDGAIKKLRKFF